MHRLRGLSGICLLVTLVAVAFGQEKTEPTERPAIPRGFRMYLVSDGRYGPPELSTAVLEEGRKAPKDERNRVGKLHDPVTEIGLYTTIGVFVRGIPKEDSPVIAVVKKQQELAEKYLTRRLGAFLAILALTKDFPADDARDLYIPEIAALAKGLNTPRVQIGLAEATLEGGVVPPQVEAWQIGADDQITIVLYHRFKFYKRWTFKANMQPTDKELKELEDEVAAIMTKVREEPKK